MVRAGEGGRLLDEFEKGNIAIGWGSIGDMGLLNTKERINEAHERIYSDFMPSKRHNATAMAHKFRNEFKKGDIAVINMDYPAVN